MASSFLINSFTFLATLLLLLAVSCAIVIRSLVLRRRFRRRVQEALANGVILPSPPGGLAGAMMFGNSRPRRDFGEKPTMWERWLAPPLESDPGFIGTAYAYRKERDAYGDYAYVSPGRRWDDIIVSLTTCSVTLSLSWPL